MKTVIYREGPDRVTAGIAGELIRGVPKELPDEVADILCGDPMYVIVDGQESRSSEGDLRLMILKKRGKVFTGESKGGIKDESGSRK